MTSYAETKTKSLPNYYSCLTTTVPANSGITTCRTTRVKPARPLSMICNPLYHPMATRSLYGSITHEELSDICIDSNLKAFQSCSGRRKWCKRGLSCPPHPAVVADSQCRKTTCTSVPVTYSYSTNCKKNTCNSVFDVDGKAATVTIRSSPCVVKPNANCPAACITSFSSCEVPKRTMACGPCCIESGTQVVIFI